MLQKSLSKKTPPLTNANKDLGFATFILNISNFTERSSRIQNKSWIIHLLKSLWILFKQNSQHWKDKDFTTKIQSWKRKLGLIMCRNCWGDYCLFSIRLWFSWEFWSRSDQEPEKRIPLLIMHIRWC